MHDCRHYSRVTLLGVGLAVLGTLAGCGSTPPPVNKAPSHLRKIMQACDLAMYTNRRPPRDLEELKPFLAELIGPNDKDDLLVSPNDGQPYVIIWGVNLSPEYQPDHEALFAYEKVGTGGKRYAITVARIVKEMSEAEFRSATFAHGTK